MMSYRFRSHCRPDPGSVASLLVHLKNSGFIILSGDVVHLEENFEKDTVPSLNTDKTALNRLHGKD